MLSPALSVEETGLMAYISRRHQKQAHLLCKPHLDFRIGNVLSGDRRETSYSYPIASVVHQGTLEASGSKQEIELHVPTAVEHHTNDEPEPDRDRGAFRVC